MEDRLKYSEYATRPRFLDIKKDAINFADDGSVSFKLRPGHGINESEVRVAPHKVYDLLQPTFFALLEDLVPGSELADRFLPEFEELQNQFDGAIFNPEYGVWVFYPRNSDLVRYAPQFWHRLALITRNSTLLADPAMSMSWQEIRKNFDSAVIAVAGVSVGNSAIHAVMQDARPMHVKIADPKDYHLSNANRVRLNYGNFGKNKAVITAEQIHAIDPFVKISVYQDGIYEDNISDFIAGNGDLGEPRSSIIIEEMDDLDMKIAIRKKAREYRIPVIMATDLASAVQLDVRRFDLDQSLGLAGCGVSDQELYDALDECKTASIGKNRFDIFASRLIGIHYRNIPEFRKIFLNEETPLFAGWAQLGSTAMAAGGIIGEAAARILLGHKLPERMFINKFTGQTIIEGAWL